MWTKFWGKDEIVPNLLMTFDHVIRWEIKNVIVQSSRKLQLLNLVVIHIKMKHYHSYVWRGVITRSLDRQLGMPTKIGGCHSYISWPNHAKVIKATAPKLVLIKSTHTYRTLGLWLCYPGKWRASNHNFRKSFKALNLKDKNNNKINLFLGLRD